jgi:predicted enzyme related to lactoylglutathione lyase
MVYGRASLRQCADVTTGDRFLQTRVRLGDQQVSRGRAKVTKDGGAVTTPKMPIQGVGWFAYCKDTEGNQFGVMQSDESAV